MYFLDVSRVIGGISAHLDDCAVSWLPGRSVIHVSRMYLRCILDAHNYTCDTMYVYSSTCILRICMYLSYVSEDYIRKITCIASHYKGRDKARKAIFQDSSDDEDGSSNDSEAAGTVEARRF